MAVARLHTFHGVEVGAVLLGGISQQSVNTGTTVRGESQSGEMYPRFQSLISQRPAAGFTTLALQNALDAVGLQGVDIAGLSGFLKLYGQAHVDGGTRAGASLHRRYTVSAGRLVPRILSADHQDDASLSYEAVVSYDGTNDPVVIADLQSLPSGIVDDERFTLGPITIGGVTIPEVRSLEVNFGLDVQSEGSDSDVWDTFVSVRSINPVLTIRGIDLEWLKSANIPLLGKAGTHANTTIYLRKRLQGGTFVVDATAQHIKLTADGLAYIDAPFENPGRGPAECALIMQVRYDGTNDPIVIDTASAIT